jgi:DNA-binding SARP family transcriptional activator
VRIYLTGGLAIETDAELLDERAFSSRQARRVFAYLVGERRRPVPRDELAEAIWGEEMPGAWETGLSALISNLRVMLGRAGLVRGQAITYSFGCYQLRLPPDTWVDMEAAVTALDEAEGALRAGDPQRSFGWAGVATAVARRPFLPGESGDWVEGRRRALRQQLVRGLDCFTEILIWNGEPALAVAAAREAVTLEPLRETAYQRLMRAQAAAGDRAEALRTYADCRARLIEELGIDPSPQTETVYLEILRMG